MANGCAITSLSWERVNLSLVMDVSLPLSASDTVEFMLVDATRAWPITSRPLGDGRFALDLNVTNFENRAQIPNGVWRFVSYINGAPGPAAGFDLTDLDELERASRSFLYANDTGVFLINFGLTEDEQPDVEMRAFRMSRQSTPTTRPSLKRRTLRRVLPRPRRIWMANRWYRLASHLNPPNGKRILFASEMRTDIEGNLLRVRDRMIERGLDADYEFRYSFRTPATSTKRTTLQLIRLIATSDIVLIDDYFGVLGSLQLSHKTKVIQLWHAGSGFKNIGFSRFGKYGTPPLQNAHRKITYAICGSHHLVPVYAEAFGVESAAIIPTGLPRIDTFLDPERTASIVATFFEQHPHLAGKRVILFAPTFRGKGIKDAYYDFDAIDFQQLYEACGADTVVLFRMHHFVSAKVPIAAEHADRFYDFSNVGETNDLLQVSDILITDYSSIIYEFSLLERPMLFFAYDRQAYAATRGFHRPYELTAPGKICATTSELIAALKGEDFELEKIEAYRRENFDIIDRNAGDRVIDQLILADPGTSLFAASDDFRRNDPASRDRSFEEYYDDQDDA